MLVAGLDAEGAAVLELWSLRWPDPMPGPAADPVSGYRAVEVAFPELDEVRRIPVDALAVQGGVHGLIELAGPPELGPRALVRHGARGEIHTLDLASGGLTLLASADAPGGRLGEIAELADSRLRFLRAGVHRSAGQAYVLGPPPAFCARGAASHRYLVLLDGDRDGQLDLHVVLCRATYLAEGWHVLAQQVPLERR